MKMGIIIVLILLTGVALSSPTTAQQQVQDLQLVEQIGGSTYAVAVQGNYAYVGVGPRLVILDISDPTHPHVIGKTEVLHDLVMDVAILGRYAYIANRHSGLGVIDVSNPAYPTEVGFYDTPEYALDVAVSGTYAYVADGYSGLRIIDVSNPAHPTEVGFYDTSEHAWGVAVSGTYAYVANGDGGLRIIDVSNPAHPIEIGLYGANALGVTVTENYVYIAGGDGLRIIDITNPTNPREIGFYSASCFQLEVSGAHVYAITGGTLDIIDITNPSDPRRIGFYEGLEGYGRRVAVWGSYVYVAVRYSNLWIIDVANPTQPTKVGHYTLGSGFNKVEVLGNYAYILGEPGRGLGALWGYKLYVADVTNPDRLNMTYAYDLWARDVALSEHYAYLAGSSLLVIDISNPALPIVGNAPTEGASVAVAVVQDYAYVASQYAPPYLDTFLNVIDISDPTQPRRVSYCRIGPGRVDEVVVVGNTAYVTDWYSGGIHIVDVSDPIYPRKVDFFPTGDPKGIAVGDNYLYLATGEGGLRIINISDPLHPQEVGANDTVYAQSVAVLGTYAYVGMAGRGLAVTDVSDPTHPRVVDTSEKAKAWNVAVSGGYIYTAADEFGLFVLRHSLLASGIVRGKVIDVSTNKGIAGALVDANNGDRSYTTTTDAGGNYTLTLPPGTYTLTASASGYQSQTKSGVEVIDGQTTIVDFVLTPITINRPPIARASDISGQPKTMYPDTVYSITVKYFDPDGRADLKYCYLCLNHPTKPLTIMWSQADGSFAPWAGEEGENYLTITDVTATPITEDGLEGYQLTWKFKIKDTWPEVQNAIDFGVYSWDDADLTSGWEYDDTSASFARQPSLTPAQEELKRKVSLLIQKYEEITKLLKEDILTAYDVYYSFGQFVRADKVDTVISFAADAFKLGSWYFKGIPTIGDALHWKPFALIEATPHDVYVAILNKWPQISKVEQELILLSFGAFKTLIDQITQDGLLWIGKRVAEGLKDTDQSSALEQLVQKIIDRDLETLRQQAELINKDLHSLSDSSAEAYSLEIDKIINGIKFLRLRYDQRIGMADWLRNIRRESASLSSFFLKVGWSANINFLTIFLASWYPIGAAVAFGVGAFEAIREKFYENLPQLTADEQIEGLSWDLFSEGFSVGYAMSTSAIATLRKIADRGPSCIPQGKIDTSNISIDIETLVVSSNPALRQKVIDDRYRVVVPLNWEVSCPDQDPLLFADFELPYRLYGIFPGLEVTAPLIPMAKTAITDSTWGVFQIAENLTEGTPVRFTLFAQMENGQLFGVDYRPFTWPKVDKDKLYSTPIVDWAGDIFLMFENKDLTRLTVYYDPKCNCFVEAPTIGAYLKSPANLAVFDSSGRKTGKVEQAVVEEIPGSAFIAEHDFVVIFDAMDVYRVEVVGTGEGQYGLTVMRASTDGLQSLNTLDIPTAPGSHHEYNIDWEALARGEAGVTVQIDQNGDGVFERTIQSDSELTQEEFEGSKLALFLDDLEPSPLPDWEAKGLWHLADNTPCASPGYSSPTHAWYYGSEASCTHTGTGDLISPNIPIEGSYTSLILNFDYYLQLARGERAELSVSFDNGRRWKRLGWRYSQGSWQPSGDILIRLPRGASSVRFKFTFHGRSPRFGDQSGGWLIDNIKLFAPLPLDIAACPPNGTLGVPYSYTMTATGGVQPYSWSARGLPIGLRIRSNTGEIYGTPRRVGTSNVQITVRDATGSRVTKACTMTITPPILASIQPLSVSAIQAFPNPVSSGVRFKVEGQGIASIQVEVYNLAGRKVFDSEEVLGNTFDWGLTNDQGRPLANGVYLYVVRVRGFDGREYVSAVRKLVILR